MFLGFDEVVAECFDFGFEAGECAVGAMESVGVHRDESMFYVLPAGYVVAVEWCYRRTQLRRSSFSVRGFIRWGLVQPSMTR